MEDWKSARLEECMIGRVEDWKCVRLEEFSSDLYFLNF